MKYLRSFPAFKYKQAFTLIEMLIVIGMIGLLVGLTVSNFDKLFGGGQEKVARIFVNSTLKAPLMQYRMHMGSYPTTAQGLAALQKDPEGKSGKWKGPYVEKIPLDPWQNEYQYRYPGQKNIGGYDLWSFGPDGKAGTDDIGNWEE